MLCLLCEILVCGDNLDFRRSYNYWEQDYQRGDGIWLLLLAARQPGGTTQLGAVRSVVVR